MASSIRKTGENIKNSTFFKGSVTFDEPMKNHTTMKVGGPAAVFVIPSDSDSLIFASKTCRNEKVPLFILGGGSNLICPDQGMEKVVISTEGLSSLKFDEKSGCLVCGGGTKMDDIYSFCQENGISGLETFAGLPGSAGGACFMNARCYDKEISDVFISAEYLDLDTLEIKSYTMEKSDWAYKKSPFQGKNTVVLKAVFGPLSKAECSQVKENNSHYIEDRKQKGHFKAPSAGSVFKNDRQIGRPSGKLIDECGLKGTVIGGAQIAPWHGNIIINNGNATCEDIKALVKLAQEKVKENSGFNIEPEVIFC